MCNKVSDYSIAAPYINIFSYLKQALSLPRAICEHWRACKQNFHQKFFCRYIYRRGSEARKKLITNYKQKVRKVYTQNVFVRTKRRPKIARM